MVNGMTWQDRHCTWYILGDRTWCMVSSGRQDGLVGTIWYILWSDRHDMVYGMVWQTRHGKWYDLAGTTW